MTRAATSSAEEMCRVLQGGLRRRHARATAANVLSSRSHCVFSVTVERRELGQPEAELCTLLLLDLAGNESGRGREYVHARGPQASSEATMAWREARDINQSLFALNQCLNGPASNASRQRGLPWRQHPLTRMMQRPLIDAKVFFIATVSPLWECRALSRLTLQKTRQVRRIRNASEENAKLLVEVVGRHRVVFVPMESLEGERRLIRSDEAAANHGLFFLSAIRVSVVKIFFSHRWLTPWYEGSDLPPATWYDSARPGAHPDAEGHPKCALVVEAIDAMRAAGWILASANVVLWYDFACIDQDSPNPALELGDRMFEIIASCDLLLSCVVDEGWQNREAEADAVHSQHPLDSYHGGVAWKDYTSRGWCRLEAFLGAKTPIGTDRKRHFGPGPVRDAISRGRRPHVVFGSREAALGHPPVVLPEFTSTEFALYNPTNGMVTNPADKAVIAEYVDALLELNSDLKEALQLPMHSVLRRELPIDDIRELLGEVGAAGCCLDRLDGHGKLPLHLAASYTHPEIVKELIDGFAAAAEVGDCDGNLPLHVAAARSPHLKVVELLADAFPEGLAAPNRQGCLRVHLAASSARPEVVGLLADRHPSGALAKDREGRLPLHWAAAILSPVGRRYVVAKLVTQRQLAGLQDPRVVLADNTGRTPADVAREHGAEQAVVDLLTINQDDPLDQRRPEEGEGAIPAADETAQRAAAAVEMNREIPRPSHKTAETEREVKKVMTEAVASQDEVDREPERRGKGGKKGPVQKTKKQKKKKGW